MQQFLDQLKSYWVILIALVSLVITWTTFQNTLSDHEKRIQDLEGNDKTQLIILQKIEIDVAVIREKLTKQK